MIYDIQSADIKPRSVRLIFINNLFDLLTFFAGLIHDLTNMSWVQEVENYGKCIILNENAELEPVKCDSNHNTICSVNISLFIKKKTNDVLEDRNNTHDPLRGKTTL